MSGSLVDLVDTAEGLADLVDLVDRSGSLADPSGTSRNLTVLCVLSESLAGGVVLRRGL